MLVGAAVTVTVETEAVFVGLLGAVEVDKADEAPEALRGDITRSRTCIKPLFVLLIGKDKSLWKYETKQYLHNIFGYYFGVVYEDVTVSESDSDRFVREGGKYLTIFEEVAVQWLCNNVELHELLHVGEICNLVRATSLKKGLVIWRETCDILSYIERCTKSGSS